MGKELKNMPNSDLDKIRAKRNPPEFEPGYEPEEAGGGFDFSQFNDFDGGGGADPFAPGGQDTNPFDPFSSPPQGGSNFDPFGGGNSVFGSPWDTGGMGFGQQPPPKQDTFDIVLEKLTMSAGAFARVGATTITSFKHRTAQEIGTYGKNLIYTALGLIVTSVVLTVVGVIGSIGFLAFSNFPSAILLTGIGLLGTGIITLTLPAYLISMGYIKNNPAPMQNNDFMYNNDFSNNDFGGGGAADSWDFGGSDFPDDGYDEPEEPYEPEEVEEEEPAYSLNDLFATQPQEVNFTTAVETVNPNVPIISRPYLVDTFKNFFPRNTQGFADRRVIEEGSQEFENLEGMIIKALMAVTKTDFDTFDVEKYHMVDAIETLFTYEIRFIRYKGQKNLDDIANEVVAYYKGYTGNTDVSVQVSIVADYYKIVIFKGTQAVVTLGDVLELPDAVNFFKNEKNRLPFCVGIQPDGSPMLRDAKIFDTMLIAGKPRSGKSWYTLNVLVNLMAFNTPEDVQIIIVDPKNSALMNTIALMPHVCGFHKNDYILRLLDDIITNEGQRREKLLLDHKCDDIWSLRDNTGIKLPLLYLFIDEYMTVVNDLDKESQKELQAKLNVLISQLPSKGIRLIFVPHRAQSIVDKTARTMISFSCAIKATPEVVKETLDVTKFDTILTNPGDTAVMMVGENKPHYVKGNAIAVDDDLNKDLIAAMAKAFYKMGVDIPDMSSMQLAANRDENHVKNELFEDNSPLKMRLQK